ncbi:hypothetical protein T492DRAFT_577981, partial [Pavlovales sp. CCMP2436]
LAMKVPNITPAFWIIKVCCTTVGETFADFLTSGPPQLGVQIGVGVFGAILAASLAVQICLSDYHPFPYWLAVILTSIEGTLITDSLTDDIGVPLWQTTLGFGLSLLAIFASWRFTEGTLDVHSIKTLRRELWYWLTIITTFALGTSLGDLISEQIGSFCIAVAVFLAWIIFVGILWQTDLRLRLSYFSPIAAFWCTYVLTRPLGASIGDLLSQDTDVGGLGLGTTVTSGILLAIIIVL